MKVLFIIDKLLTYGDAEMNVVALASELAKDNSVYLLTDYYDDDFNKYLGNVEVLVGFEEDNYAKLDNLGIEVINSNLFMSIQVGRELSQRLKADFYITIHGMNIFGLTLEAVEECNGVIYTNEIAKEACRDYVPEDKGYIVYNPIDMSKININPIKDDKDFLKEGYKTIVVATRMNEERENLLYQLLEISPNLATKDTGINILFIGGGNKLFQMVDVAKKVRSEKVNIRFTGEIDDLYAYFHLADLVIASDRRAIEAMLCKKPVFYMGLSKWKDVVSSNNYIEILFTNELTANYTDETLTEKLLEIMDNPDTKELDNLYTSIEDLCSSVVSKEKILNLYQRKDRKD